MTLSTFGLSSRTNEYRFEFLGVHYLQRALTRPS